MFDLGWLEFAIVGLAMIVVLGPKELPHAMRSIARFMRKARRLASEFQGHVDDIIREADLDDVKKSVNSIKNQDINTLINDTVDPTGDLKKQLDGTMADAKREMQDIKASAGVSPTASAATVTPKSDTAVSAETSESAKTESDAGKVTSASQDKPTPSPASASSNA